jgi:signal transduction histidine kinase
VRRGLAFRTIVASGLLAILVGTAFALLVRAIGEERDSAQLATHSQEVIGAASGLERLVLDLETGHRGYLITRDARFLEPWRRALAAYPAAIRNLNRLAAVPAQNRGARRIAAAVESYAREYSVPLVEAARRGEPSASSAATLVEGRRRVDAIRGLFDRFVAAERRLFAVRDERADTDARRAIGGAAVGLAASMVLIVLFGGYLTRAIAMPVRRAASMAGQLAGGDLATRMPETGVGEVGALERSFNTMAGSLEASRDELRQLAEEQAALRRVATLVARRVPAPELFDAVAGEVHRLLGADAARLIRYEPDGTATPLSGRGAAGAPVGEGARFALDGEIVAAMVFRTGRPARKDTYEGASGEVADAVRGAGIQSAVGAPVIVEDRLWGVMIAAWKDTGAIVADTEERMAQFTELIGTAIANAQSRAELAASRARVVATADETRRRIERDLHDGAQQRLVHTVITLKLAQRAVHGGGGDSVTGLVDEALEYAERANAELRDLAHGVVPASLSRGLSAGVETLVSRVRLPVSIEVTDERLPQALEATAYFIIAEAMTNVVKHAGARSARIRAYVDEGALHVEVRDDGVGGAQIDGGSGLLGLHDRAAAMDGQLTVDSPPGRGTTIAATMPVPDG